LFLLRKRGQRPLINNTKYIYDGFKVIQEKESGLLGNHAVTYLRGSSLDEILSRTASPSVYYYEDIRGSVRGITDTNSNLIQSYEYTAFGERTSTAHGKNFLFFDKGINQPYGFTGRPIDKVTGLYNYRLRDYNPEIGRFIQPDPLGQIPGPNIYAYCNNNPINWVDPWGMDKVFIIPGTTTSIYDVDRNYITTISRTFSDAEVSLFAWDSNNTDSDRQKAGERLSNVINRYRENNPNERVIVVAHSHGGNVGVIASGNANIDIMITMGTPVRDYMPNMNNIGEFYNFYSVNDQVQIRGGQDGDNPPSCLVDSDFWFQSAGRTFDLQGISNIEVPFDQGPAGSHTQMPTLDFWDTFVNGTVNNGIERCD